MKRLLIPFIISIFSFNNHYGQQDPAKKEFYNKDFGWKISIPAGFTSVPPKEWKKMQNKGLEAIEDTYEGEVINQSRTIFVFKNGDFNYMEANWQPFDAEVDGNYDESWQSVNEIVYETYQSQMPGVKLDSSSATASIGGLLFREFEIGISFPNGMRMTTKMFSRLFEEKEFSLNIVYMDDEQGKAMTEAWRKSVFE